MIDALVAIDRGQVGPMRFGSTPLVDPGVFRLFCSLHKDMMPRKPVRPTHGDAAHLAEDVVSGLIDAALVTLPLSYPELHIEEVCRNRLVVCLPKDHALARNAALHAVDLQSHLAVLYHPQRHPDAHRRLLELLGEAGVRVEEYSSASHPSDMQELVKEGYGFALIREGTVLDEKLTGRPIEGVDWTVDTAVIYHAERFPKTLPVVVKKLKRRLRNESAVAVGKPLAMQKGMAPRKRPVESETRVPVQLPLLDDNQCV